MATKHPNGGPVFASKFQAGISLRDYYYIEITKHLIGRNGVEWTRENKQSIFNLAKEMVEVAQGKIEEQKK